MFQALTKRFQLCNSTDLCLNQFKWNKKLTIAVPKRYFQSQSIAKSNEIHCIAHEELSHGYELSFFYQKNFKFIKELNEFIHLATEGGLITKWLNCMNTRISLTHGNDAVHQVTMEQVLGLIVICLSMLSLATCLFFFEKIVQERAQALNASRGWIFAQMIIDPNRYFLNYDLRY